MTRFFLDTEFIETDHSEPVRLVSLGVVDENGREFYAETLEARNLTGADAWFHENVVPHLNTTKNPQWGWKTRPDICRELSEFVADGCKDGSRPEFWGYFADYDWMLVSQLYGRLINAPKSWPKVCFDIRQLMYHMRVSKKELPKQTGALHNALEDAKWNREAFKFLADRVQDAKVML